MHSGAKATILFSFVSAVMLFTGCGPVNDPASTDAPEDSLTASGLAGDAAAAKPRKKLVPLAAIESETGMIDPDSIVAFARTLMGIPYLYASTDPAKGFDCSGLITYVFNHFNLAVPRSSVDFTDMGTEIPLEKARPGDLILFTGTDSTLRVVGHMGIVESINGDQLNFIHSSSGKANGVVITPFENYYRSRFVKLIRVFPEEFFK